MLHYQVFRDSFGALRTGASIYACQTDSVDNIPSLDTDTCSVGTEIETGVYAFSVEPGFYYYYYINGSLSKMPVFLNTQYITYYVDITIPAGIDTKEIAYTDMTDVSGQPISAGLFTDVNKMHLNVVRVFNERGSHVANYNATKVTLEKDSIGNDDESHILLEIKVQIL